MRFISRSSLGGADGADRFLHEPTRSTKPVNLGGGFFVTNVLKIIKFRIIIPKKLSTFHIGHPD
jgi:hypothetical protein